MPGEPLPADVVDMATFEELLEMDEDDPGFSQSLVENFFEQTEDVLKEMQRSLALRNLDALSRQGHFLKGSAAAIGIIELRKAFERIQYLGQGKVESDAGPITPDQALAQIEQLMGDVSVDLAEARRAFAAYYQA
ncbi:hypothetical protein AMAG_20072 [Allomyces macrogynus ATCC 38327]|uniref:HPt domain-containing protein n=1 Tax=Allomyces macrogynus (strain ATCC 38327) TaxID=578462 RepID=A0A0L0T649_ALLM3|nr:hypothetical protein AMAG_20072 [Allomyces macrogynus ATCC 38327]|eukprot:KNE70273.1 hypothetical protein AMAG_20072 [Allomyces macrogynus ATCC 38327]